MPIWEKVRILRNRVFGHRSRSHTTAQLFKLAKVTPDELGTLIKLTKKALNAVSLAVRQDQHAFNLEATSDAIHLLDDLQAFHKMQR